MRSDGRTEPSLVRKALNRARFELRGALVQDVEVTDEQYTHSFRCEDPFEVLRAATLLDKEAGTIGWIRSEVRPGDVFYDVGASIGVYTLVAARRVGEDGAVYAFEPHLANAQALLHNVRQNELGGSVKVLSCALSDRERYIDFDYLSDRPATYDVPDSQKRELSPLFSELKHATTLDRLVEGGFARPPSLVKIDVDGAELQVIQGMRNLLLGDNRPRSVQVEVNRQSKDAVDDFMEEHGFTFAERHHSSVGLARIAEGGDPDSIIQNVIYRPSQKQNVSPGK
jgi:FkbM family methyltransferase